MGKNSFYILILLIASACGGPKVPDWHPHIIKTQDNKCIPCELVDKDNFVFKCYAAQAKPLSDCNGFFATPPNEVTEWRNFAIDVTKNYTCKLKQ